KNEVKLVQDGLLKEFAALDTAAADGDGPGGDSA
ncbi:MAG: exodeoxyribonuclease VII small subunit, partial [Desulfovibrio sp.]|nr:exodeoxyribonuclease VII small subunit [Desulfovibrio sp.]